MPWVGGAHLRNWTHRQSLDSTGRATEFTELADGDVRAFRELRGCRSEVHSIANPIFVNAITFWPAAPPSEQKPDWSFPLRERPMVRIPG